MYKKNLKLAITILFTFFVPFMAYSMPVPEESGKISLNGTWKLEVATKPEEEKNFKEFYKMDFKDDTMKTIKVPSNWELEGFEVAQYGNPTDYVGFYRRWFKSPELAQGERLILHFEGVLFGTDVWINEKKIGSHLGGFTGFEFDITDAINLNTGGRDNLIAVRVIKQRAKGYEFDCHDTWALSGIHRDVYLYKLPPIYFDYINIKTDLDNNYKNAQLILSMSVANSLRNPVSHQVTVTLFNTDGKGEIFSKKIGIDVEREKNREFTFEYPVENPQKWTAETPVLYHLFIQLEHGGRTISTIKYDIGFREIKVDGNKFLLNGVPIKLRGVDRHELSIEGGSALTTEDMMQDIELMKKGNINTVRTSHYPPDPEFLDLCDKYGIYIIDEVPFGYGDIYLNVPDYLPLLKTRLQETYGRDRNHPSVIIWSLGNENEWSYAHGPLVKLAKKLDKTRPILLPKTGFSTSDSDYNSLTPEVDILAPHYPDPSILKLILMSQLSGNGRPVIMTEYLHSLGRAIHTRESWDLVWKYPSSAGGCVWLWADQGIKRPVNGRTVYKLGDKNVEKTNDALYLYKWIDANNIVDSHAIYGTDGIVDADRSPQPDYFEIKKIYTPIYISDEQLKIKPGQKELEINLQNRYDFTNIEGMRFRWELWENFEVVRKGEGKYKALAPYAKGTITVPVDFPADTKVNTPYILNIYSYDFEGNNVDTHQVELKPERATAEAPAKPSEKQCAADKPLKISNGINGLLIGNKDLQLAFDSKTGVINQLTINNEILNFKGPVLNTWRPLQLVELTQPSFKDYKILDLLQSLTPLVRKFEVAKENANSAEIVSEVFYKFPNEENKGFLVKYLYKITCGGTVDIDYEITSNIGEANLLELGMKFEIPPSFDQITVVGCGPDTYPHSIKNTETSLLQKMKFKAGDAQFTANKTEVLWVEAIKSASRIKFELPSPTAPTDSKDTRNFRAESDSDKITLYFNPQVKHPSKKNSDPPEGYMIKLKDGIVLKSRITLKLKS